MAVQLRVKVVKALAAREQQARKRNLTKYIPNAAQAIFTVTVTSWFGCFDLRPSCQS